MGESIVTFRLPLVESTRGRSETDLPRFAPQVDYPWEQQDILLHDAVAAKQAELGL